MDRTAASVLTNRGTRESSSGALKVKDIWAIRVRLQIQSRTRDLALLDLGIDIAAPGHAAIRSHCGLLGRGDWALILPGTEHTQAGVPSPRQSTGEPET